MHMRYSLQADVYECPDETCTHKTGHSIREDVKIHVTAESNEDARRKALNQCYAVGSLVRRLVIKSVHSIL